MNEDCHSMRDYPSKWAAILSHRFCRNPMTGPRLKTSGGSQTPQPRLLCCFATEKISDGLSVVHGSASGPECVISIMTST